MKIRILQTNDFRRTDSANENIWDHFKVDNDYKLLNINDTTYFKYYQ